jgi:hypothetical protein
MRDDFMRAPVPRPGERLPIIYCSDFRNGAIRADVTYLRQDFSVCQPVANPKQWPKNQRYDYVVRKRELTADEARKLQNAKPKPAGNYAQRDAVLFALRELTGKDCGTSRQAWERQLAKRGP